MEKQIIISISREFGSGGHYIAEKLSKELGILLLDQNMLEQISENCRVDMSSFKDYDEKPKNLLLSRSVRGMSNSYEDFVTQLQFEHIKNKADSGESMVVVGRCADYVLKGHPGLINIFISADMEEKVARIKEIYGITEEKAKYMILKKNQKRKQYHNHYTDTKWGSSRCYELCINSSKLGLDGTADIIKAYVQKRIGGDSAGL